MADDFEREAIESALDTLGTYFGEGFPEAATLSVKGDGIVGRFVRLDEDVDLRTGFAPVDMLVIRGVTGVWHTDEGVERARKGSLYSIALMHQTLRNRLEEAAPLIEDELIAIRRGRVFESKFNPGQKAVAYDVAFPERQASPDDNGVAPEPAKTAAKASKRTRRTTNRPDPAEEQF